MEIGRWDCIENDMENFDLALQDAQHRNKCRKKIEDQLINPVSWKNGR